MFMSLSEKIAVSSVVCVLSKFVLAGAAIKFGSYAFNIGSIDALTIASILTPTLGAVHLGSYVSALGNTTNVTKT